MIAKKIGDKTSLFLMLISMPWYAQNLVPNHSFEYYNNCPTTFSDFSVKDWKSANTATPDYYNSCDLSYVVGVPVNQNGYQLERNGMHGYAGFYTYAAGSQNANYREYIQCKFTQPLKPGSSYCISMYVNLAKDQNSDSIGCYFSSDAISGSDPKVLNYTPQLKLNAIDVDSISWMLLSGVYIAAGGEQYLTIGNFLDDSKTTLFPRYGTGGAYYLIDDVVIEESISNASIDSIADCCTDSVVLLASPASSYLWSTGDTTSSITVVSSTVSIVYSVTVTNSCSSATTSFTLKKDAKNIFIPNIFTPNNDGINDFLKVDFTGYNEFSFVIYNRWGNMIQEWNNMPVIWDGKINNQQAPDGTYYYTAKLRNGIEQKGFIQLINSASIN